MAQLAACCLKRRHIAGLLSFFAYEFQRLEAFSKKSVTELAARLATMLLGLTATSGAFTTKLHQGLKLNQSHGRKFSSLFRTGHGDLKGRSFRQSCHVSSYVFFLHSRRPFCRMGNAGSEDSGYVEVVENEEVFSKEAGELHLILGPMFAGKTTALLERVQLQADAGRKVALVKSNKDTRYGLASVVSHTGKMMPCAAFRTLADFKAEMGDIYAEAEVIGIDEAQFFEDLFSFCKVAADFDGKTVIVAGLDGDFLRRRFGSALDLVPVADTVTKLSSRCEICNKPAAFTFRKTHDKRKEVVGGADVYMPLCRKHYVSGQVAIETTRTVLEVHRAADIAMKQRVEVVQS